MKTGKTTLNIILDRIRRNSLLSDIPFETVVDYAIDFMRIVGIPTSFLNKIVKIHIEDYRGEMPCDFYEVNQVRPLFNNQPQGAFRHTTDTFHLSNIKPCKTDFTYTIQNSCIFTSIKNGDIEMAYKAIPVDDEGYPLIPDNAAFIRALESYIKKQYFTILFDKGELHQSILQNVKQEYAFNVAQASAALIMPNQDEMQDIVDQNSRLIPRTNERRRYYETMSTKERLKNI